MDIDMSSELPDPDAQRTELQRYAILQQEYQSFLLQHDRLVSKSNTQDQKIDNLENKTAQLKGLLEEYTAKHQQINDAYHRALQEHEDCQKEKDQLHDLAYRWKAQLEDNMELNRHELRKALESRPPDNPLQRAEEVQAPVAIEATTESDFEYSDKLILDDPTLYTWTAGSDDPNQYELFLSYTVTEEYQLRGYGFDISQSIEEAIPQITDSLRQADIAFGKEQYHAITSLGMHLINTEPVYLFACLEENRTIFIGCKSVLAAFPPALTAGASSSQPSHLIEPIKHDAA